MEEINELIRHYHLEEDIEYVIIPYTGNDGRKKRCFLLKRRFIRILFPEGHFVDYPLTEAIEATIKYPDLRLSQAINLLHKNTEEQSPLEGDKHDSGSE
ncbi:MAG: hypothetical protein ACLPN1_12735 [Dissulfurispiraceae bacterium]|jgi:hypothetical protein